MTAIGRWSCGTSWAYWLEISCARAACSAASSSARTRTRPRRGPTARGRCAARPARAIRRTRARAGRGPASRRGGRQGVHDRQRRLLHQLLPAKGARQLLGERTRSLGVGALPANQSRIACTARARARSPTSANRRRARAPQRRGRIPARNGSPRRADSGSSTGAPAEVASVNASRRNSATRSTLSSARRMSASARQEPISDCSNRSVAMARARVHSPARWWARAEASVRRQRASGAPAGSA